MLGVFAYAPCRHQCTLSSICNRFVRITSEAKELSTSSCRAMAAPLLPSAANRSARRSLSMIWASVCLFRFMFFAPYYHYIMWLCLLGASQQRKRISVTELFKKLHRERIEQSRISSPTCEFLWSSKRCGWGSHEEGFFPTYMWGRAPIRSGRVLVNENLAADRRITQKTLNSVS